jgi:hypothetical protein
MNITSELIGANPMMQSIGKLVEHIFVGLLLIFGKLVAG